jgi:hypothetical protein
MGTTPPSNSNSRELLQHAVEAGLQFVPGIGGALAVTFVTAVTWRLNQKREEWLTALAEGVEDLRQQLGDIDLDTLVSDARFTDAVVSATRTVEHTDQKDKLDALRNAVLNSVGPDAPDADTQSIFMNMVDRFTSSHLRMLALWDDPPAWFASHGLPGPATSGNRARTVEAALPEMRGRGQLIVLIASELKAAQLLAADMTGMVSEQGMMQRLTTDFGRQLVRFVNPYECGPRRHR